MTDKAINTRPIDIAMGFDDRYAPHAAAAIASIVRASAGASFRFTMVHDGVPEERRQKIEDVARDAIFHWVEIGDADIPAYASREHFSRAILFRLGLETAAPADCERMIYVDTDTICTRDIRELWSVDMGGQPIAAVQDCFVDPVEFARLWSLDSTKAKYFNSGILLIDMKVVRSEGGFRKAIDFVAKYGASVRFADQDALNFAFWGRWKPLEIVWNAQRHMAITALIAELPEAMRLSGRTPAIIHFTGPEKPWVLNAYHPWAWLYWSALRRSSFFREISRSSGVGFVQRLRLFVRLLRKPVG